MRTRLAFSAGKYPHPPAPIDTVRCSVLVEMSAVVGRNESTGAADTNNRVNSRVRGQFSLSTAVCTPTLVSHGVPGSPSTAN